jgi:hypothetical protein
MAPKPGATFKGEEMNSKLHPDTPVPIEHIPAFGDYAQTYLSGYRLDVYRMRGAVATCYEVNREDSPTHETCFAQGWALTWGEAINYGMAALEHFANTKRPRMLTSNETVKRFGGVDAGNVNSPYYGMARSLSVHNMEVKPC